MRLGLLTIGQSPRDDVVPEIRRHLPPGVEVLETGALDGLSPGEIVAHRPTTPARTLVTRLRDGREVVVDAEFVHHRLQEAIGELGKEVEIIGLLCSGRFPKLASPVPLLIPYELLRGFLAALSLPGPFGVLVPSLQQIAPMEEELRSWGVSAVVCALSPYRRDAREGLEECVRLLRERGARAVVLNCFGYGEELKRSLRERLGIPVVAVRSLFARALRELL